MCGATDQQEELQSEQIDAYKQAMELTQKQYGNQQAIFGPMAKQWGDILNRGPNQRGFSAEERDTLNANALNTTANNYKNAQKAVGESLATEGGGNNPLTTGAEGQIKSEIAQSGAEELSREEGKIRTDDYSQGYDQWLKAGQGLLQVAGAENPVGYESAATEAGGAASKTAKDVADSSNSWVNAAIGAAGSIVANSKYT